MKVLIITDAWHPQVNGVVRTYEYLGEELRKRGHKVKVTGPADYAMTIPMPGYAEIKLVINPHKRLKRIIEEYQPTDIHISTEGPLGWAGRKYCLKNNIPFTTSYHTHFPDYIAKRLAKYTPFLYGTIHELAKKFVRTFHAPAKTMMVATKSLEDELNNWGFKTPKHYLSRGANLDLFQPGEKTAYPDLKAPIALYVGRIAIEKNIEDFLAMAWDGSKVVVGDGPSKAMLESKYPDVHFVGIKQGEDLAAHYRSADVFVFPSRTDTFGIVLVEALASGIPVAGYNVTGPKDIVTENLLGAIEETDLAKASKRAMEHGTPEQRAAYIKNKFNWDTAGKQFEEGLLK